MANDAQSVQYHADVLIIITILEHTTHDTLRRTTQRFMSHPEQAEQLAEAQTTAEVKLAKLKQLLIRVTGISLTGRYFVQYI
jgi:hypothetical protein